MLTEKMFVINTYALLDASFQLLDICELIEVESAFGTRLFTIKISNLLRVISPQSACLYSASEKYDSRGELGNNPARVWGFRTKCTY